MKFVIQEVKDFNECGYNGIPKTVHLIWVGGERPQYLIEQIQSWQKHLDKDWELRTWGDEELEALKSSSDSFGKKIFDVAEHMPETASYVDIIRLYILYCFGGYYFDADFQVFRDIEPITHVDSDIIMCNSTKAYYPYVDNAFLGCTKGNGFIRYCLDSLIEKYDKGGMENDWIIRRTGPVFVGYSMVTYEGFERVIKSIPAKYLYSNEKGDVIIIRGEDGDVHTIEVEETFNGRMARHMFVGNGTYEKTNGKSKAVEEKTEKVPLYFPKQKITYTKDYDDPYICAKSHDVGDYTYGHPHVTFYEGEIGKVKIGKFCSISNEVTFFVNGYHNINCVSKYPFCVMEMSGNEDFNGFEYSQDNVPKKKNITIGNDVYIGFGATIMGGVNIGDGAVIGAYSVVCKDVEPYEVVGGNPAKHIKYLFDEKQRKALVDIAWWDWDFEKIKENCKYISSENVDLFIEKFGNKNL